MYTYDFYINNRKYTLKSKEFQRLNITMIFYEYILYETQDFLNFKQFLLSKNSVDFFIIILWLNKCGIDMISTFNS